jgi:hypothetical protein
VTAEQYNALACNLNNGGSFSESGFGFSTQQAHGPDSGTLNAGFRICMQSDADGIALLAPKAEQSR